MAYFQRDCSSLTTTISSQKCTTKHLGEIGDQYVPVSVKKCSVPAEVAVRRNLVVDVVAPPFEPSGQRMSEWRDPKQCMTWSLTCGANTSRTSRRTAYHAGPAATCRSTRASALAVSGGTLRRREHVHWCIQPGHPRTRHETNLCKEKPISVTKFIQAHTTSSRSTTLLDSCECLQLSERFEISISTSAPQECSVSGEGRCSILRG